MTRKEAERLARQSEVLQSMGFTAEEAEQLRRISTTLHRWHELECGTDNGCIERDDDGNGRPFWRYSDGRKGAYMADREAGAKKRLTALIKRVNVQRAGKVGPLSAYVQTDPRGAALYILRPGDVPEFDAWAVWCKGDDGQMTRATSQTFRTKDEALAYLNTVARSREPELRQVPADPAAYYNRGICVY